MTSHPHQPLTPEQYLEQERQAGFKSEYVNGETFAMAGSSLKHARLVRNLSRELDLKLTGSDCEVFTTDVRLEVAQSGSFTYPDVMVVCGGVQVRDSHLDTVLNPTLIIEVFSPSTEGYDRGRKFDHYRSLASVQEYVLVDQEKVHVEQRIRLGQIDREWLTRFHNETDEAVRLESIRVEIPIKEIYRNVACKSGLATFRRKIPKSSEVVIGMGV